MKEMNFPQSEVNWKSEKTDGGYYVTLSSKTFICGAYLNITGIDNAFSDNYFDLLPGERKVVTQKCPAEKLINVHSNSAMFQIIFDKKSASACNKRQRFHR